MDPADAPNTIGDPMEALLKTRSAVEQPGLDQASLFEFSEREKRPQAVESFAEETDAIAQHF